MDFSIGLFLLPIQVINDFTEDNPILVVYEKGGVIVFAFDRVVNGEVLTFEVVE